MSLPGETPNEFFFSESAARINRWAVVVSSMALSLAYVYVAISLIFRSATARDQTWISVVAFVSALLCFGWAGYEASAMAYVTNPDRYVNTSWRSIAWRYRINFFNRSFDRRDVPTKLLGATSTRLLVAALLTGVTWVVALGTSISALSSIPKSQQHFSSTAPAFALVGCVLHLAALRWLLTARKWRAGETSLER